MPDTDDHRQPPAISAEDLDMLRNYESGHPRIFDAASLMPRIFALLSQGLIEPVSPLDPNRADTEYIVDYNNGKACRITDKGRELLETTE